MTLSIWRYSHFILAITASLFLLIASITGCILAIEPIEHQTKGFAKTDLSQISLSKTITNLNESFDEVFTLEVEPSGFVKASVLTSDFESKNLYINPENGNVFADVAPRASIYNIATNLHRSLFLKTTGRIFVFLVSILLVIIAFTGVILLAKRQGGITKLFSKVQKDKFEVRYHVVFSRWFLVPILIIALTGIYLSIEKFDLLPKVKESTTLHQRELERDFVFEDIQLSEVRKVTFPFSEDPDEYFQIELKEKEILVAPDSGKLVKSTTYPFLKILSGWSYILHTGEGNVVWSIVLFLANSSILFFMYSGFVIAYKRIRTKKDLANNTIDKSEAEFIILVGSETGSTYLFASSFFNALKKAGKKAYIDQLNSYTVYDSAKQLIVFTSTYGDGDAPSNAQNFESLLNSVNQPNKVLYTVLGFGSLSYPNYCVFAKKVEKLLNDHPNFICNIPLFNINNASTLAFLDWINNWEKSQKISLSLSLSQIEKNQKAAQKFKVVKRTLLNSDDTFILELKPKRKLSFNSGDLLAIYPEKGMQPRYYSVAKIKNKIVLSIKKHSYGKASSFLYNLKKGDVLNATLQSNPEFHFPKTDATVVLIANGTGIAPFLGMLSINTNAKIHLFWGGRTTQSIAIYNEILQKLVEQKSRIKVSTIFSKEPNGGYVQDIVLKNKEIVLDAIQNKGCIMICGSMAMQNGVLQTMESLLPQTALDSIEALQRSGQLKMDCY